MKRIIEISEEDYNFLIEHKDEYNYEHTRIAPILNSTPLNECEETFKDDNTVSRLSVRDILYANAYELEYPDGSSEYVVNRDEAIKYVMELPSVDSKSDKPSLRELLPTMRGLTTEEREAINKSIRDMCYDTGVTLQGLMNHETYIPKSVLKDIISEVENYTLSDDEKVAMDEDSIKWGMKIVCEILEERIGENTDGSN